MKRVLIVAAVLAVLLAGCSGVILNAEYTALLDRTAAISAETAARAEAGELDSAQMARALRAQAEVWRRFQLAREGRGQ